MLLTDDGKDTKIGSPFIAKTKVDATFVEGGRDKKMHIIKFKSKSNYSKKIGHRQPYSKVKIVKV